MITSNTRLQPLAACPCLTDTSYLEKGALYSQFIQLYRSIREPRGGRAATRAEHIRLRVEISYSSHAKLQKDGVKADRNGARKINGVQSMAVCIERPEAPKRSDREDLAPFLQVNIQYPKALSRTAKLIPALDHYLEQRRRGISASLKDWGELSVSHLRDQTLQRSKNLIAAK